MKQELPFPSLHCKPFVTPTHETWILRHTKLGLCSNLAFKKFSVGKYLAFNTLTIIVSWLVIIFNLVSIAYQGQMHEGA